MTEGRCGTAAEILHHNNLSLSLAFFLFSCTKCSSSFLPQFVGPGVMVPGMTNGTAFQKLGTIDKQEGFLKLVTTP